MERADRIRLARDWLNVSQEKLADLLDVAHSTVSRWERGVTETPDKKCIRIASVLGLPVGFLLDPSLDEAALRKILAEGLHTPPPSGKPIGRGEGGLPPMIDIKQWRKVPVLSPAAFLELAGGKTMDEVTKEGFLAWDGDGEIAALVWTGGDRGRLRTGDAVFVRLDYGAARPGRLYLVKSDTPTGVDLVRSGLRAGRLEPGRESIVGEAVSFQADFEG